MFEGGAALVSLRLIEIQSVGSDASRKFRFDDSVVPAKKSRPNKRAAEKSKSD